VARSSAFTRSAHLADLLAGLRPEHSPVQLGSGRGSLVNQNRQRQASVERHASERADREMPTVRADLPIGIFRWRVAQAQRLARESPIGDAAEPQTASRGRRAEIALVAFPPGEFRVQFIGKSLANKSEYRANQTHAATRNSARPPT